MGEALTSGRATQDSPTTDTSASKSVPLLLTVAAGVGIGAAKAVTVLAAPERQRLLVFKSDDVYYYLLTALNQAQGLGSTFDGINPTNGYQPAWYWLLVALFWVTDVDRSGAVTATIVVLIGFWLVAVALLWRVGNALVGPWPTVVGITVFCVYSRWWTGCENALTIMVLLSIVALTVRRRVLIELPSLRTALTLGVLLAVLGMARLDGLLVLALVALGAAAWWPGTLRARGSRLLLLTGPTGVTLLAYLAANRAAFGVAVPVSGLAKQLGSTVHPVATFGDFLLWGSIGPLSVVFGAVLTLGSAAALVLLKVPGARRSLPSRVLSRSTETARLIGVLYLAQIGQVAYYAFSTSWELQDWYFYSGSVGLFLSAAVVGATTLESAPFTRVLAATTLVVVILGLAAYESRAVIGTPGPTASPALRNIDAGQWVDRHLAPGSVVAMGDWAGSFAYSTRFPVVQLEGLVNAPSYLAALENGTARQLLASQGVTHLARMTHPGEAVGCTVEEPFFGTGPRVRIDVCAAREVYRGEVDRSSESSDGLNSVGVLHVWELN